MLLITGKAVHFYFRIFFYSSFYDAFLSLVGVFFRLWDTLHQWLLKAIVKENKASEINCAEVTYHRPVGYFKLFSLFMLKLSISSCMSPFTTSRLLRGPCGFLMWLTAINYQLLPTYLKGNSVLQTYLKMFDLCSPIILVQH